MPTTRESSITIKIEISDYLKDDKTYFVGRILEPKELSGCICQADTEDNLKKQLGISMQAILQFYQAESKALSKLAIWRSNKSEHGQFWFTIVGLGLIINKVSQFTKVEKGWKYLGITKQGALVIGNRFVFFQNYWRK